MRFTLLCFVSLIIWACQPTSDSSGLLESSSPLNLSEDLSTQGAAYYHLNGNVGDYPIHMYLLLRRTEISDYQVISGNYYYDLYTAPIALNGSLEGDSLLIYEENPSQNEPPRFVGKIEGDSVFVGQWYAAEGQNPLAFRLRLVRNKGSVVLESNYLQDSVAAIPSNPESPKASYDALWLNPKTNDVILEAFLRRQIALGLSDDSLSQQLKQPESVVQRERDVFFEDYQQEIQEGLADGWIDTNDINASLAYQVSISMTPYFNDHQLLTLGYTHYYFSGGAHGNYGTSLQTIDLDAKKVLQWEDVFSSSLDSNLLSKTLEKAALQRYELNDIEELRSMLFEDQIPPTDNFGLTQKGVVFVYSPYEIAPYAVGEIELFVPYQDITEALKPEFLIRLNKLLPADVTQ